MISQYDIKDISRAGDIGIIIFEDYNRERESISEAIEEVLRNYDKNRQNG